MKACSVEGCERPRRRREWCSTHYTRWLRHGDPTVTLRGGNSCSVDGCDLPYYGSGWCGLHYARVRAHGSPEIPERVVERHRCQVEGCEMYAKCRGWCDVHYRRWLHNGDPLALRGNGRPCSICDHGEAEAINLAILSMEESRVEIAARIGIRAGAVNYHARTCLGFVLPRGKKPRPGSLHDINAAARRLDAVRRYVAS